MKNKPETKEYFFDAAAQSLGRLASEIAKTLQGKNEAGYKPNVAYPVKIKVKNAAKIKITQKKLKENYFTSFSGYPGGLKRTEWLKIFSRNPSEFLLKIIKGMLPKNRLLDSRLKNLTIEN